MATIIPLNREPEKTQDSVPYVDVVTERSAAEIVLFPGVRYEHWSGAEAEPGNGQLTNAPATVRSSATARDWLEI